MEDFDKVRRSGRTKRMILNVALSTLYPEPSTAIVIGMNNNHANRLLIDIKEVYSALALDYRIHYNRIDIYGSTIISMSQHDCYSKVALGMDHNKRIAYFFDHAVDRKMV